MGLLFLEMTFIICQNLDRA